MRLTSHTDFGLRTLMYLASRPRERVTTAEVAEALRIPRNHLLKVVHRLQQLGWLDAKRGPAGGVRFAPGKERVSVGEVVRRLEQNLAIVECFRSETNGCPLDDVCRLAPLLHRARNAFLEELDEVTVGDLVPRRGRARKRLLSIGGDGRRG